MAAKSPTQAKTETPRESANQVLRKFLVDNSIVLTLTPLTKRMKTVDDGSLIIEPPQINAQYTDQ